MEVISGIVTTTRIVEQVNASFSASPNRQRSHSASAYDRSKPRLHDLENDDPPTSRGDARDPPRPHLPTSGARDYLDAASMLTLRQAPRI